MENFMPHGMCLQWNPALLSLFVVGNLLVALAYFSIPVALGLLVQQRKDLSFKWMYGLFGGFIVACGLSHVLKIWTIWHANYWVEAGVDLATGIISVITAILLWRLLPSALSLPGASEQLFQRNFDLMPQLGWTANAAGEVDFFNKGWYDYTGKSFAEMKGWGWQSVHDPEIYPRVKERWLQSVATLEPFEMEFPLRGRDGQFRYFLTRINPSRTNQGNDVCWVGVSTDIHDQKELEELLETKVRDRTEKLEKLAEELARSNQDLRQFAYAASHDLQEPLRTVSSFCSLLNQKIGADLNPDCRKYLATILEATVRMQKLIKALLQYATVGAEDIALAAVCLEKPVATALDALQAAINETSAVIECEKLPFVTGDATQLSLLFQNLIGNSIKFRGTAPPEVHISARKIGDNWEVAVRDNGCGFKMDYAERIFLIFQKLHSIAKYEGTGIGLATCKRIVERHGGTIRAESRPGAGATFFVTLKAAESLSNG